jgi:hypothetical protein
MNASKQTELKMKALGFALVTFVTLVSAPAFAECDIQNEAGCGPVVEQTPVILACDINDQNGCFPAVEEAPVLLACDMNDRTGCFPATEEAPVEVACMVGVDCAPVGRKNA